MQKIILFYIIITSVLLFCGCEIAGSREAAPESAQRLLKLRGYNFDEKNFFAAGQARFTAIRRQRNCC